MQSTIRAFRNTSVSSAKVSSFLQEPTVASIRHFHQSMPGYSITPLVELQMLSQKLGIKNILVKDESKRFGLNAFKGLGGSYAIFRAICQKLNLDESKTTFPDLQNPGIQKALEDTVFVTATDGNHGKGVSWAAGLLGCKAVVYMPKGSSEIRAEAIRKAGEAEVSITGFGYDDTVRMAAKNASENGWILVQDTSWENYEKIPAWIIQGYTTLAAEAVEQMEAKELAPTHVFLQAGVGAMAGGILGYLATRYAESRPMFSIVEPASVACIYASARKGDGKPHAVVDAGPTIMAGLNCGEPCTITWPILRDFAEYYFSCPDFVAAEGMRAFARPIGDDPAVVSGESGAATFGLLLHLLQAESLNEVKKQMKLNENSVVFLINTEGDTDPACYRRIVENGEYPAPLLNESNSRSEIPYQRRW